MSLQDFLTVAVVAGVVLTKWNDITGFLQQLSQATSGQQPPSTTGTEPTDQSNPKD